MWATILGWYPSFSRLRQGPGTLELCQSQPHVHGCPLSTPGHLFYKFGITESDWYRIKQSIDSKCRTAWRRKQRGQSLAVKSFSRRTPSSSYSPSGLGPFHLPPRALALHLGRGVLSSHHADPTAPHVESVLSTPPPASELQPPPQALHYTLANAQQVQIHQIGEDGQVQVVRVFPSGGG